MTLVESYALLNVDKNCTEEELKKKYRKLLLKYHPDINKSPTSEEECQKIITAYKLIQSSKFNLEKEIITYEYYTEEKKDTEPVNTSKQNYKNYYNDFWIKDRIKFLKFINNWKFQIFIPTYLLPLFIAILFFYDNFVTKEISTYQVEKIEIIEETNLMKKIDNFDSQNKILRFHLKDNNFLDLSFNENYNIIQKINIERQPYSKEITKIQYIGKDDEKLFNETFIPFWGLFYPFFIFIFLGLTFSFWGSYHYFINLSYIYWIIAYLMLIIFFFN